MRRLVIVALIGAAITQAAPCRRWWASVGAIAGAATLDVLSSRGKMERNPLAAGAHGQFSLARGVALKAGVTGVLVLVGRKRQSRALEAVNWGVAGAWTGAAVYNWRVPKVKP